MHPLYQIEVVLSTKDSNDGVFCGELLCASVLRIDKNKMVGFGMPVVEPFLDLPIGCMQVITIITYSPTSLEAGICGGNSSVVALYPKIHFYGSFPFDETIISNQTGFVNWFFGGLY